MIKEVEIEEISSVMEIIADAKRLLKKQSSQWQNDYPNQKVLLDDISNQNLFGFFQDGLLIGIESLIIKEDENYKGITLGKWIKKPSQKDLVIHRIAVRNNYHNKKIGDQLIKFAIGYAKRKRIHSIKVDTHKKNIAMQKILLDNNFSFRGIIYLKREEDDNQRLAYELVI